MDEQADKPFTLTYASQVDLHCHVMLHRHLNHQLYTLAAIDDVIGRGKLKNWADLRRAVLSDRSFLEKVLRVCNARISDPYAQRYHFWKHYADRHLA